MKKILLFLSIFLLSISNINALTLCDNTEILDLPADITTDYGYIIVKTNTDRYRIYSFLKNSDVVASISSNTLSITNNDSSNSIIYYQTNSAGTTWSNLGSNNTGYTVSDITLLATTIDITDNGNIVYNADYNLVCNSNSISNHIYVPDLDNYKCFVVRNEEVIRAYEEVPTTNATIPYRDYYYNSNYLYTDGNQQFTHYSTLPICLSSDVLTTDVYYRNDFDKILIIFIILAIFIFYIPLKIFLRFFRRFQ